MNSIPTPDFGQTLQAISELLAVISLAKRISAKLSLPGSLHDRAPIEDKNHIQPR